MLLGGCPCDDPLCNTYTLVANKTLSGPQPNPVLLPRCSPSYSSFTVYFDLYNISQITLTYEVDAVRLACSGAGLSPSVNFFC